MKPVGTILNTPQVASSVPRNSTSMISRRCTTKRTNQTYHSVIQSMNRLTAVKKRP